MFIKRFYLILTWHPQRPRDSDACSRKLLLCWFRAVARWKFFLRQYLTVTFSFFFMHNIILTTEIQYQYKLLVFQILQYKCIQCIFTEASASVHLMLAMALWFLPDFRFVLSQLTALVLWGYELRSDYNVFYPAHLNHNWEENEPNTEWLVCWDQWTVARTSSLPWGGRNFIWREIKISRYTGV